MIDLPEGRQIALPVQRIHGHWEVLFGGDVPAREGSYAQLVIRAQSITDRKFRALLDQEIVVRVLEEGALLHVAISDHQGVFRDVEGRHRIRVAPQYWPGNSCGFAPVRIGPPARASMDIDPVRGGLWMRHIGLDRCELISSQILLPDRANNSHAVSLNHAFTQLSEQYETHRISHTGNVYERIFYEESSGEWYPLAQLRDGVRDRAERQVVAQAWAGIEAQLGWCRLPAERKERRRRSPRGEGSE